MSQQHVTDLHAELQNDETGARRADLLVRLRGLQENCQAAKRQLLDRDAYARVKAATVAVTAAIRIVEKLPAPRAGGN
jgi:hypothetical protein